MAAWRYEISLLVLKKYFTSERSERVKYFSTLEEKFRISARPCNILYIFCSFPYKPSFFCPPCWQLRRFGYLHFYLSVCCLMFRTPGTTTPLNKRNSIASDFTTLDEGETWNDRGVKMFQRSQLGFQSQSEFTGATNNSHQQCFLAFC